MSKKVQKKKLRVIVYTSTHRIEGTYSTMDGIRLLDDLNARQTEFVPLTDVRVTSLQNESEILFRSEFVAVNVHGITLFSPNPKVVNDSIESRLMGRTRATAAEHASLLMSSARR